jgi:putative transposase
MSYKTYEFLLTPSASQFARLQFVCGSCRFVYNHFLTLQTTILKNNSGLDKHKVKFLSYSKMVSILKVLLNKEETSWLERSLFSALQIAINDLDNDIKSYINNKCNFPKFRSKYSKVDKIGLPIYTLNQFNEHRGIVNIHKVGLIKYDKTSEVTGEIMKVSLLYKNELWYLHLFTTN